MTKFFQKIVEKNTESNQRYYRQAEMQSLQCIAAMGKELDRLNTFIDSCAFLSICRSQMQNSIECKWSGEALHNEFQEFNAVVSQYCKVFLGKSNTKINQILEEMLNAIKTERPSFVDLINNIWNIKFLAANMTNEKSLEDIRDYHFFTYPDTHKETTVTNRCTII